MFSDQRISTFIKIEPQTNVKTQHESSIKLEQKTNQHNTIFDKVDFTPNLRKRPEDVFVLRYPKNRKSKKKRHNMKGHWCLQQNAKYYLFLRSHFAYFKSNHLRRLEKIFKEMSDSIGTRTANQCRSHHQKQQLKYNSLEILMMNLYQETRFHVLLKLQPPFQKDDFRLKDNLDSTQVQAKSIPFNIPNNVPISTSINVPIPIPTLIDVSKNDSKGLVIFEMPQLLQQISFQKYKSLFLTPQ